MFTDVVIIFASGIPVKAAPVNATGQWQLQATNGSELITGVLILSQVVTQSSEAYTALRLTAPLVSETKMNAKFNGPRGAGWLTVYFTPDGKSFQG